MTASLLCGCSDVRGRTSVSVLPAPALGERRTTRPQYRNVVHVVTLNGLAVRDSPQPILAGRAGTLEWSAVGGPVTVGEVIGQIRACPDLTSQCVVASILSPTDGTLLPLVSGTVASEEMIGRVDPPVGAIRAPLVDQALVPLLAKAVELHVQFPANGEVVDGQFVGLVFDRASEKSALLLKVDVPELAEGTGVVVSAVVERAQGVSTLPLSAVQVYGAFGIIAVMVNGKPQAKTVPIGARDGNFVSGTFPEGVDILEFPLPEELGVTP